MRDIHNILVGNLPSDNQPTPIWLKCLNCGFARTVGSLCPNWEDTPDPLGMPLQNMVTMDAIVRTSRYASSEQAQAVSFNPVGQVVGMMNDLRSSREVIVDLVEGYLDAIERLNDLQPE